jgi:sulfhydrogenase subunit beta (sulfur reductase)
VPLQVGSKFLLEPKQLNEFFDVLRNRGYRVLGPVVRDRAIVYDELSSTSDLPAGWTDEQDGGTYRLKKRSDHSLFGFVVGPQSWKRFLLQPEMSLWRARRDGNWLKSFVDSEQAPRSAFIGVRSCELHAIAIQDKVFVSGEYADPSYKRRRENLFVVAVNCVQAGGTCFCASMGTGPKATFGFDLALTEALDSKNHYFLAEVGSKVGAEVLSEVTHKEARQNEIETAEQLVKDCASQMGRTMETKGIKDLLYRNYANPRWDDVADRCLTCGNCTMVCPTCFCTTVEDCTDLSGSEVERRRRMDVCFTMDFSYIHGGSIRASPKSRYRQWMTHKLATWIDQFGTSGCVGCGRCITWCPVAIDITEEVRAIRESELGSAPTISTGR